MRDPVYPPDSNLYILFFLTIVVLGGAMLFTCNKSEPESDPGQILVDPNNQPEWIITDDPNVEEVIIVIEEEEGAKSLLLRWHRADGSVKRCDLKTVQLVVCEDG